MHFDVIVVGGGAAGLFCALTAARRRRRVLLLEHQPRLGNKILISGGGRCNFTNLGVSAANYVTSGSPNFVKSALARFTPRDFLALVDHHGIAWHERKHGQLFCLGSSRQILEFLIRETTEAGVEALLDCQIAQVEHGAGSAGPPSTSVEPSTRDSSADPVVRWRLATSRGPFTSFSLVVATGGLSFPKLGATSFGYDLAAQFGIQVVPRRPGLVPLVWNPTDAADFAELSGIAVECEIRHPGCPTPFRENLLFTHRGLSGPSVLQISNYWRPGESVDVNLLPGRSALDILLACRTGGRDLKAALRGLLPERLASAWASRHAPDKPIAQWPRQVLESVAARLHAWKISPAGDEGYAKAEVTVGGIDTSELSSKTLECRRVPGLFFIGEVVDITGWLGGYNFQWAWASGHAAGQAV